MRKDLSTLLVLFLTVFTTTVLIVSCAKEFSCEGCRENKEPPIANAGSDQATTLPIDSVVLDGSASNDPDGTISVWSWRKISGPLSCTIVDPSAPKTVAKDLDTGVYLLELKVTDNDSLNAADTVQVIVTAVVPANRPPIANAGDDMSIASPASSVILDGSKSSDPDGTIVDYSWQKISGPSSFSIINANDVQTPVNNLVEGVYKFELKVTDNGGLISNDTVQVTVKPNGQPKCLQDPSTIEARMTYIGKLSAARMPTAAAAGNKVVFAGGWSGFNCLPNFIPASVSSAVDIYDISSNSWLIAQLSIARAGIRSVSLGNKIFFAGGENGVSTVYDNVDIYDISTNSWTTEHLSLPRAYVATAAIGNKVFFAGGYYYTGASTQANPRGLSNIVDIYDVSTNRWSSSVLPGTPTGLYTATAVNGKVYFAGGDRSGIISVYDNNSNTWATSSLQFAWQQSGVNWFKSSPASSFAVGNDIYWVGGVMEDLLDPMGDRIVTGRAEIRNTLNDATNIACFPVVGSQLPVLRNNEVAFFQSYWRNISYAGGGWNEWSQTQFFDIYNFSTGRWSQGRANALFITGGHDAGIVSLNNTVYVGGGADFANSCIGLKSEVYILSW